MKCAISVLVIISIIFSMIGPFNISCAEEQYEPELSFDYVNDPSLMQYIEDSIYANMDEVLDDNYVIQDISAVYLSVDYLEEMEYYSRKNNYFGSTLEELDAQFGNTRYYFTLGDNHQTIVKRIEEYKSSSDLLTIAKNVAIGSGVLIVCVLVTYFTKGTGTPKTIQIIHTISNAAKGQAIKYALSSTLIGSTSAAIVEYNDNGNVKEALNAAAIGASEGYKWGAIIGSANGVVGAAGALRKKPVPSWQESENTALKIYSNKSDVNTQVSYYQNEMVKTGTDFSTRPDIVRVINNHVEAIEVKNYDCKNYLSQLANKIKKQVTDRVLNLPEGSTQRIVLDFRGRGYSQFFADSVIQYIQDTCMDIYPDIPVDIIWA